MKRRILLYCSLFFIVGTAAGWTAKSAWPGFAPVAAVPAPLLAVPDVFQSTNYSCGASVLQSVLAYWGIEVYENELQLSLGTTKQRGTPPESIIRVARSYGLAARMREGATLQEISTALGKGVPVILDIQAWQEPSSRVAGWDGTWEDGHYVIAVGVDTTNVYVEDPSLLGCRGFIPLKEFDSRWHDYEGDPPYSPSKRSYTRMAIFIEGKQRPSTAALCRVN
jgi:predicted double-glycine peptidase